MSGPQRPSKDYAEMAREELIAELESLQDQVHELELKAAQRDDIERSLRESEARLQAILEHSSVQIVLKDPNGRYVLVSRKTEDETGLSRQEIIGKTAHDIFPKDAADRFQAHDREVLRSGRPVEQEETDRFGDHDHTYLAVKFPIFDTTGAIEGIGTIETDITDRKRAEGALRESEQRFKDFADSASQWFWEMGPDLRFSYVSDSFEKSTGVSPDYVIGKTREEFGGAHHEDKRWQEHLADLSARRPFHNFEYAQEMGDGRINFYSVNGIPVFDDAGKFKGYRGTGIEITERRKAEEALRTHAKALAEAQRVAKLGHWRWSIKDQGLISCSEEFARIYGLSPETVSQAFGNLRDYVTNAVHPDDRERVAEALAKPIKEMCNYQSDYRILRPDGTIRHVSEIGEIVYDAAGRPMELAGTIQDITERKKAEEALRSHAAALAEAQRVAKLGHWYWSIERDELISCSEECARIHGVPMEGISEHFRTQIKSVIHPEDRALVAETFEWADEQGCDYELEYRVIKPDGEVRHVLEIGEAIPDPTGKVLEQKGTIQDITERKVAEEALRQSEERYRRLVDLVPEGIFINAKGKIALANPAAVKLLGAAGPGELLGTVVLDIIHPDYHDAVRRRVAAAEGSEGNQPRMDQVYVGLDSREFPVEASASPIRFQGQAAVLTVFRDISERKRAEEALRESERRLAMAIHQAKLNHWRWSFKEQRLTYLAETRRKVFGTSWHDPPVSYEDVAANFHPDDRDRVVKVYRESDEGPSDFEVEYRIIGPDGETRYVRELGEVEYDEQGEAVAHVGFTQDITDLKRTEEALRTSQAQTARAREQLVEAIETISEGFAWFDAEDRLILFNHRYRELYGASGEFIVPGARFEDIIRKGAERGQYVEATGRVEEWVRERVEQHQNPKGPFYQKLGDGRWLQIEERKLPGGGIVGIRTEITRLKEMEDELLRKERLATLGQLTGMVSHELRNPLGAIRTSVMAIKILTEDIERPRLKDSVDIADRSITRCDKIISDLLDVTRTPKLQIERTAVDAWLVGELAEYQLPPGIELCRDLESNAQAAFDRDRLGRALRNVIDNACQAMEANGEESEKILTVATILNSDRVEISVADTGSGIAPEEISRVFEPLYSTKSFGVGLGMPMVRQILQQHGGGVEIVETSSCGANVVLWLPIETAASSATS